MQNSKFQNPDASHSSHSSLLTPHSLGILTVFLLPTYLIRFSVFGVPTNMLDALLMVFLTLAVLTMRTKKQLSFRNIFLSAKKYIRNPLAVGVILLFLGLLLSAARGGFTTSELGIIKSWFVLPFTFVMTFFFLSGIPDTASRKTKFRDDIRKYALLAYILSASAVSLIALGYFLFGETTYDGRLRAFYDSPNQLAMYIAPALVLAYFVFRISYFAKKILHVLAFCMILALYFTYSYGAWISVIASILAGKYILSEHKRAWVKFLALGVGIGIILVVAQLGSEKLHDLTSLDERSSLASRQMIWRSAWHIGKDHWLLGIGPGNFQDAYLEYQKFYPPYLEWAVPQPHNLYLAFWIETGILGLFGFLLLIVTAIRSFLAHDKKTATLQDVAVFCALLTILLHGLIDTPYWKNDLSVVFWLLIASTFMYNRDY